jgi:hypothetical protein
MPNIDEPSDATDGSFAALRAAERRLQQAQLASDVAPTTPPS